MYFPSLSVIASSSIIIYLGYTLYSFWSLVQSPVCHEEKLCIYSHLKRSPRLQLSVFTSFTWSPRSNEVTLFYKNQNFDYKVPFEKPIDLDIPYKARRNGTLFAHIFVSSKYSGDYFQLINDKDTVHITTSLTKYYIPDVVKVQLLSNSSFVNISTVKPVSHIKKILPFIMLSDDVTLVRTELPGDIYKYLRMKNSKEYLPIISENFLSDRISNLKEINLNMSETEVVLKYDPVSYGKLRFLLNMEMAFQSMIGYGFKDKELDDIKSLMMDTNFYLLMATIAICFIHLLFDFLAFKNDIHFWKTRQNLEGLSARTIIWRATSQTIILLFLVDEGASLLVVVPAFIGVLIEVWKVHKMIPIDWRRLKLKSCNMTDIEKQTKEYDAQSMKYLSYLLYPLCILGALYSLVYDAHRNWYSWIIRNLVNGVYAFGFLFMLPQLFINYKLKSVAHLPWRTFMYKTIATSYLIWFIAFAIVSKFTHETLSNKRRTSFEDGPGLVKKKKEEEENLGKRRVLFSIECEKMIIRVPMFYFLKAFNTFIDDFFAFIITMPTAHRLACFRDDIVFLIYMYQRWLYPVDKKRLDVDTDVTETTSTVKKEQ